MLVSVWVPHQVTSVLSCCWFACCAWQTMRLASVAVQPSAFAVAVLLPAAVPAWDWPVSPALAPATIGIVMRRVYL